MSTVLVAVTEDAAELQRLEHHLTSRYGSDYDVYIEASLSSAGTELERLAEEGRPVAIVLVDWATVGDGADAFLGRVARLHPGVKRGVQISVGDRATSDDVLQAAARGLVEFWVI